MAFWGKFAGSFWRWYNGHIVLNTVIAAGLFTLQLIHLYWLTTDVVALRLFGRSFFPISGIFRLALILVDYTEIPALLSTSIMYINQIRNGHVWRGTLFFFFININSQWLHIFWITDEFVIKYFVSQHHILLTSWLATLALAIDYLEIPVIVDMLKNLYQISRKENLLAALNKELRR